MNIGMLKEIESFYLYFSDDRTYNYEELKETAINTTDPAVFFFPNI